VAGTAARSAEIGCAHYACGNVWSLGLPLIPLVVRSAVVILKPVVWKALGDRCAGDDATLSGFLREVWSVENAPVLHGLFSRLSFPTRLDGPSTGLIVVAIVHLGVMALHREMQAYRVSRCYVTTDRGVEHPPS